MKISRLAKNISPSPTLAITAKAKQMKADGVDVLSFAAGEPDFDTPDHVKQAAIKSLEAGNTKYAPVSGSVDLKKAICKKLQEENGVSYQENEIIVSLGAKHSIFNAVLAIVDEGEEVIIPAPYWVSYPEIVGMAGGKCVYIDTDESTGFTVPVEKLAQHVTDKTRMLILNSPSNPTGGVYTRKQLEDIAALAVEKGFYVLSDEIYEKIIYDGREHVSIASLGEDIKKLTITVNGLSKAYSMTGWRLGYIACDAGIVKAMNAIQSHSTSNPVSFTMPAAVEAITGDQGVVSEMVAEFDKRRKYIVERLNDIDGISCDMPGGAFYVFPNISGLFGKSYQGKAISNAPAFAEFLLEVAHVAVVDGAGFGADNYARLSYATSMDVIEKGMDRIKEAVGKLN